MKLLHMKTIQIPFTALLFLMITTSCNNKPNDAELQDNIAKQMQSNQGYTGVNASVKEGVVTLTGACEGENCASEIERQVKGMEGVKKVENNIQHDQSTDLTLRTSVQSTISKYEGVQADVAAGVVVLRGSISRDQVQPLMNELQSHKPKKIDNQLAIK